MTYIKARFLDTRKILQIDNVWSDGVERGDLLVVKSEKGEEIVQVLGPSKEASPVKALFLRKASIEDLHRHDINSAKAKEAHEYCKEKIKYYNLDMKLIKTYIPLDASKVFFYYTAEQRVDFRVLVRDLARQLKKRIEMRQIGVRDAVQMMGWVGSCGEISCCYRFEESFESISLRDIEEQNLPLSPSKFTGPCGRLVCCLAFERDNYTVKNILPEVGTTLCYQGKEVKLLHVDPLREKVLVDYGDKREEVPLRSLLPLGYERAIQNCKRCVTSCRKSRREDEDLAILYK